MPQEFIPKEGSGYLFANRKRENDSQPNAKGTAMFDGQLLEISAWTNVGKNGERFQSLRIQRPREQRQEHRGEPPKGSSGFDDMQSDVPF